MLSGYNPKVGDWVKIDYEGGHTNAPWIVGPSMAEDEESDPGGVSLLTQRTAAPPSPTPGEMYYDQTEKTWKGWDGSQWVALSNRVREWGYSQLDADATTTSTVWVAVNAASLKVSLIKQSAASVLFVFVNACYWYNSGAGNQNLLGLNVDGTLYIGLLESVAQQFPGANQNHHPFLLTRISGLAAGTRVITPVWRVTAGTGTIGRPRIWAVEVL